MTRAWLKGIPATVLALSLTVLPFAAAAIATANAQPPVALPEYLQQGEGWGPGARAEFYNQDQGSRILPLAWVQALKLADRRPFLADGLARYGYLPNPASNAHLPIGFTASGPLGSESLGMTCAACHTRDLEMGGRTYRVDGGPALSDFQGFLGDLMDAVGRVRSTPANFSAFASAVLGPNAEPDQIATLRSEVDLWYLRQDTLFSRALPKAGWGVGRLDAVSMIFDRLTGLDIGPTPTGLIAENIYAADAPVRYPFIWNAPRQDHTQWPGFAPNGDDILGLVRNLGEVYGVFGRFAPQQDPHRLLNVDFLSGNSANFDGLTHLEKLVRQIGPPKWPFAIDQASANRGEAIFNRPTEQGGCAECHAARPGTPRLALQTTWATWLGDVGTDSREYAVLDRTAKTGVLAGTGLPLQRLGTSDTQFDLLFRSVVGSIAQQYTLIGVVPATGFEAQDAIIAQRLRATLPKPQQSLFSTFGPPEPTSAAFSGRYKYEARVLEGVWAAAPYLHNGSVASLADLLKPDSERTPTFLVGRAYDTAAVGLAKVQPGSTARRFTSGCDARNSGNSRCGHEFGTSLTAAQKTDLLEYMKKL